MAVRDEGSLELDQWAQRLTQALQILDLKVDTTEIVAVAEKTAEVAASAGVVSAFYVGYAAAMAGGQAGRSPDEAVRSVAATVVGLAEQGTAGQDSTGWAATGQ